MITISIHALLAESDKLAHRWAAWYCLFLSTLSLRRATLILQVKSTALAFLSTLSLRRATVEEVSGDTWARDFYPRSPCGERRTQSQIDARVIPISIHALLAESDPTMQRALGVFSISIHALLAESDGTLSTLIIGFLGFLSTLSLRRAT